MFPIARGVLDGALTAETEDGKRKQFGKFLAKNRDRVVGKFRIVDDTKDHSGRPRYKLDPVAGGKPERFVPKALAALQDDAEGELDLTA